MNTVKIYTELRSDFIEHNLGESHVIMTGGPVTGGARGAGGAGGVKVALIRFVSQGEPRGPSVLECGKKLKYFINE